MTDDKSIREVATQGPTNIEEQAIDAATVAAAVGAGAAVVSAGAAVYAAAQSAQASDPPPPDPPTIELPPGVDRDES